MRFAELAVLFAPIAAYVLWRWAVARGLSGPPPRQLLILFGGLLLMAGWLIYTGEHDRLPPGRYVPAHVEDGTVVEGHTEPFAATPPTPQTR